MVCICRDRYTSRYRYTVNPTDQMQITAQCIDNKVEETVGNGNYYEIVFAIQHHAIPLVVMSDSCKSFNSPRIVLEPCCL